MFIVECQKNQAKVRQTEPITSGSQNVYVVQFKLSEEWDPLTATAVFMAGNRIINVLLDSDRECMVPWEVMQYAGEQVMVGVFGTMGGNVVLPTIWASMGNLQQGVTTGIYGLEPTPTVYQQIVDELARVKDQLQYGIPYAIDGLVDVTITELSQISNLKLPCNVILLNSGFSAGNSTLRYANEIVYLETKEDPITGVTLTLTDWDGNVYDFKTDENGAFTEMVFVRDGTIKTPYQLAVENGFLGTETDWLNSLRAKSLYEIAVANGFVGTEADFLESLKGKDGEDGKDGTDGLDGTDGKSAYWINAITTTIPAEDSEITIPASEWNILPKEPGEFVSGTITSPPEFGEPFLYFIIGKTINPINESFATVHIDTMTSLIVDLGEIVPKLIDAAATTTLLDGGTISEDAGNTAGAESIQAIAKWVAAKLVAKQDALPEGESGSVLTYGANGYSPQKITNDILPVVDPEHGGTGQDNLVDALMSMIDGLTASTSYILTSSYIPIHKNGQSMAKVSLSDFLLWATGRNTTLTSSGTDYTTQRARAIGIYTTAPGESTYMYNGYLYAVTAT